MKHAAKIEPGISRAFTLPLEPFGGDLLCIDAPQADDWRALPKRFLDGIELTSRFIGNAKHHGQEWWKIEYAHLLDGKAIATDNKTVVEYDVGKSALACTLTLKQLRMIKAFEAAPSYHSTTNDALHLRWANGNRLALSQQYRPAADLGKLLDPFEWEDFDPIDEDWRAQVVGHFSFKPVRDNEGLMTISPDRITGGVFDDRPDTELRIQTHTEREVSFEQATLLNAVRVATEIKFVHEGAHSRLLFRSKNVRGVAVSRQRVTS